MLSFFANFLRIVILFIYCLLLFACSSNQPIAVPMPEGKTLPRRDYPTQQGDIVYYPPAKDILEPSYSRNWWYKKDNIQEHNKIKIALLLPLSGKYADLGQGMLDAAQISLFNLDSKNIAILPFDTKGTAFGATEAAKIAVEQDVKLFVGPVFSSASFAAAKIAHDNNINVISFSNDETLTQKNIFILGIRPEQQIRRVIRYALMNEIEDYAAVFANNAFGAASAKEMRETVASYPGASVLKTEFYRQNTQGKPIKFISYLHSALNAALNKKPDKYYDKELESYNDKPIKYPRGLVVPEDGENLELMVNYLQNQDFDREKIVLIGSSKWGEEEAKKYPILEGALVAVAPKQKHEEFEKRFFDIYGYKAPTLASLAYDAMAMVVVLARMADDNEKGFSRAVIANPRGFLGVDGIFRFRTDGTAERGLVIKKIVQGTLEVVSPSPVNFSSDDGWLASVERRGEEVRLEQVVWEEKKKELLLLKAKAEGKNIIKQ